MHETPEDLRRLQDLLDSSHSGGGSHLRSILTHERRLDAPRLAKLLTGVQVLNVATVTARCEPLVAPVDGLFYRGAFHFGSAPESVRFLHLRSRPQVSASHTRGEELSVVVHGRARLLDMDAAEQRGFRACLIEVYGHDWEDWAGGAAYARIEARKMFTFSVD